MFSFHTVGYFLEGKIKAYIEHLHDACLSLDQEHAFKASIVSACMLWFAVLTSLRSTETGFFHMKNCRPGTCLTHFSCKCSFNSWVETGAFQREKKKKKGWQKYCVACLDLPIYSYSSTTSWCRQSHRNDWNSQFLSSCFLTLTQSIVPATQHFVRECFSSTTRTS